MFGARHMKNKINTTRNCPHHMDSAALDYHPERMVGQWTTYRNKKTANKYSPLAVEGIVHF
ncbi:hypothetical protein [Flagellimonas baculiformis]|uniref:hypothetical protein n=1 Tax=Flagellimonas baculiformis TaxID=3067310 RepID=UPI00296F20CA|nr:hypothetical protein [Muricauda sp. D6]